MSSRSPDFVLRSTRFSQIFVVGETLVLFSNAAITLPFSGIILLTLHSTKTFSPPVPPSLSLHLSVVDAALLLHVRTLAPQSTPDSSLTGLALRNRLGLSPRPPVHDELDQVFHYRGEEVTVKEKVRVESQDPSLIAVMAKLSALGHAVGGWRLRVAVVMGEDLEGDA